MTLVKTNRPFTRTFDGLMNDLFNDMPSTIRSDAYGFPPVNIIENSNAYQLELSVAGFDKADFTIKLDGNILTISTEKAMEHKSESAKIIRREFHTKAFKRSFTIDEKIEASNINATYQNGILQVDLPKKEQIKALTKEINIQ